jgi:hypothetical protein
MGVVRGVITLPCKKIVEKPPRNSAGFCVGGQGLSWAEEEEEEEESTPEIPVPVSKHHYVKTCGEVEVELHAFLTSATDESEWSASRPGVRSYDTH